MGGTVCIIEDDDDMREVLARVVRSAGVDGGALRFGRVVLRERHDNSAIGCMLVDVQLRGLNGIALLEKLAEGAFIARSSSSVARTTRSLRLPRSAWAPSSSTSRSTCGTGARNSDRGQRDRPVTD